MDDSRERLARPSATGYLSATYRSSGGYPSAASPCPATTSGGAMLQYGKAVLNLLIQLFLYGLLYTKKYKINLRKRTIDAVK